CTVYFSRKSLLPFHSSHLFSIIYVIIFFNTCTWSDLMKKVVYMLTICSALLLFGCSEDKASEETESVTQTPDVNKQEGKTEETTKENTADSEEQTSTDS